MRRCTKCGQEKEEHLFRRRLLKTMVGYMSHCKECQNDAQKVRRLSRIGRIVLPTTPTILKCSTCGEEKPTKCFNRDRGAVNGYDGQCKKCARLGMRAWREKNREKCRDSWLAQCREKNLKKFYGISIEDYDSLLHQQEGRCKICGTSGNDNGRRLSIDHDHETGRIRGILCAKCNTALGMLGDDPILLHKAANYLEEYL